MAYRSRYKSRYSARPKRKKNLNIFATLIILAILGYVTLFWVLPSLIDALGFVNTFVHPPKTTKQSEINTVLAPPVITIPYEATNTAQIDLHGYGSPGSQVKIYLNDALKDIATVDSDGTFVSQNLKLEPGINQIYGKSVDQKDAESFASKTISLTFDNQNPTLDVYEPNDDIVIQGERHIKVSGRTDVGDRVYINGVQMIVDSGGNFSYQQPLNDGDNTITITARDSAGNLNQASRKVTFQP